MEKSSYSRGARSDQNQKNHIADNKHRRKNHRNNLREVCGFKFVSQRIPLHTSNFTLQTSHFALRTSLIPRFPPRTPFLQFADRRVQVRLGTNPAELAVDQKRSVPLDQVFREIVVFAVDTEGNLARVRFGLPRFLGKSQQPCTARQQELDVGDLAIVDPQPARLDRLGKPAEQVPRRRKPGTLSGSSPGEPGHRDIPGELCGAG